jgi:hypothetical protein
MAKKTRRKIDAALKGEADSEYPAGNYVHPSRRNSSNKSRCTRKTDRAECVRVVPAVRQQSLLAGVADSSS